MFDLDGFTISGRCPWCGKLIDELYLYFTKSDDAEFECPNCDKPLRGARYMTYHLTALPVASAREVDG